MQLKEFHDLLLYVHYKLRPPCEQIHPLYSNNKSLDSATCKSPTEIAQAIQEGTFKGNITSIVSYSSESFCWLKSLTSCKA